MVGVQRHLDMLAFNLASRESATEELYQKYVREMKVMPAAPLHRNFEQMQASANDLLSAQIVNDALNLGGGCLHNVHFFLTLVKANHEFGSLSPEAQKEAQAWQQELVKAPLDQKFNLLEEQYGIMCELEDTIVSLGFLMQALAQQGGVVKKPQLGEDEVLELDLKVAKAEAEAGDMWRQPDALATVTKTFAEGDRIAFSTGELQSLLLTVAVFGHQLFTAASNYARENRSGA